MKNDNPSSKLNVSRALISYNHPNLTNASFRWQPDAIIPENPSQSDVSVGLSSKRGYMVVVSITRSRDGLSVVFMHYGPGTVRHMQPIAVAIDKPIHVELDIDPKTSNVVYWVNDKGMDMGVLDGFKGGADSVRWLAGGHDMRTIHGGEFMDCSVATEAGWRPAGFRSEHVEADELHPSHALKVSSHNSIVFGHSSAVA